MTTPLLSTGPSDWLTALLDRPEETGGGVKTLSWLPEFTEPTRGFVEGMPGDQSDGHEATLPVPSDQQSKGELEDAPQDEPSDDPLVDLLREALGDDADEEEGEKGADPDLDGPLGLAPEPEPDPIAEAFAQGKAAGREEAIAQHEAEMARHRAIRQTFRTLDQAAMDALAGELCETVIALCAQSLADFIPAPDALKQRCLQAAERLGSEAGELTLYLHPDDLTLLDRSGLEGWKLVGDPQAERGGLRLVGTDGSLSDRPEDWRGAIAAALRG